MYAVGARFWASRTFAKTHSGRLEPLEPGSLRFRTTKPPAPAFFQWNLVVHGAHSPQRQFVLDVPLETDTRLDLNPPRGRYTLQARLELSDIFGLTRFVPGQRWEAVFVVEPAPHPFRPPLPPATRPGQGRSWRKGRREGDPFDVRAYAPGDDLRRLHWPLYAHAGVPFVRTAEPAPPPAGHQFIVLDTEAPSEEALDGRLGQLTTWLNRLDEQGTGWTLTIPATGETLSTGAGRVLAALTPKTLPSGVGNWPESVAVLTSADSSGTQLSRRLAGSGYRLVLAEPILRPQPRRDWWRR